VNAVVTPNGGNCISGSTLPDCTTTVTDVPPSGVEAFTPSTPLAFTGVTAKVQIEFAALLLLLGIGLLVLSGRRRRRAA
jgi:hypothetical protein